MSEIQIPLSTLLRLSTGVNLNLKLNYNFNLEFSVFSMYKLNNDLCVTSFCY